MRRDDFVDYLTSYAKSFDAPVLEGVEVDSIQTGQVRRFVLKTSAGIMSAQEVVLASGGYQKPHLPSGVAQMRDSVYVIDVDHYTNPSNLPRGKVLVLGSGQSGCQVAEDLVMAGREVCLACGRAPWLPRRLGGRDIIAWLVETSFVETTLADLPNPEARLIANPQFSGRDGGHDLNYRTLQGSGVRLLGHFSGSKNGRAQFASDLTQSVAFGDSRYHDACDLIMKACASRSVKSPEMPTPPSFSPENLPDHIELNELGAVVVTSGFRPDYGSFVKLPSAFDSQGFPLQQDGSSTVVPGLHFMGVHFQRKRLSATLFGVGEDAKVLAENLVGHN